MTTRRPGGSGTGPGFTASATRKRQRSACSANWARGAGRGGARPGGRGLRARFSFSASPPGPPTRSCAFRQRLEESALGGFFGTRPGGRSRRWSGAGSAAAPAFEGAGRGLALGRVHVGAALVELLVLRQQVGAFLLQPGEEDVLDLTAEVEGDAAEEGRPRLAGALDYRADLVGVIVDAGHQRGDEDTGVDAAAAQRGNGVEAGG